MWGVCFRMEMKSKVKVEKGSTAHSPVASTVQPGELGL